MDDDQGVAVVLKQKPACRATDTGHARAAGIKRTDAVHETVSDEMSVAADNHICVAAGEQRLELLIGDVIGGVV